MNIIAVISISNSCYSHLIGHINNTHMTYAVLLKSENALSAVVFGLIVLIFLWKSELQITDIG